MICTHGSKVAVKSKIMNVAVGNKEELARLCDDENDKTEGSRHSHTIRDLSSDLNNVVTTKRDNEDENGVKESVNTASRIN